MKSSVRNMSSILGEKDLVSLVPGVCDQVYRTVCVSVFFHTARVLHDSFTSTVFAGRLCLLFLTESMTLSCD